MEAIILENASTTELKNLISEAVKEELKNLHQPKPETELLTRKEVKELLKISLPTLNEHTKSGKFKGYLFIIALLYRLSEYIIGLIIL